MKVTETFLKGCFIIEPTVFGDKRGSFSEIVRSKVSGQVSYSITNPKSIRGNHFHTRKIERFSVIKGKAKVEMRKIGSNHKISFLLNY